MGSVPSLLTGGREHEARKWRGAAVPEGGGCTEEVAPCMGGPARVGVGWCCWCAAVAEARGTGLPGRTQAASSGPGAVVLPVLGAALLWRVGVMTPPAGRTLQNHGQLLRS